MGVGLGVCLLVGQTHEAYVKLGPHTFLRLALQPAAQLVLTESVNRAASQLVSAAKVTEPSSLCPWKPQVTLINRLLTPPASSHQAVQGLNSAVLADEAEELEEAERAGGGGGGAETLYRLKCALLRVSALMMRCVAETLQGRGYTTVAYSWSASSRAMKLVS